MKSFKFLLLVILVFPLYSQKDSHKYTDCSCSCIESLTYKTLPDSFKLGLKHQNPGAYNLYEYYSIAESSLVKFTVYDLSKNSIKETEYCLHVRGNYQFSLYEFLKPVAEYKSGVYYLEMVAATKDKSNQLFTDNKKFILVK